MKGYNFMQKLGSLRVIGTPSDLLNSKKVYREYIETLVLALPRVH